MNKPVAQHQAAAHAKPIPPAGAGAAPIPFCRSTQLRAECWRLAGGRDGMAREFARWCQEAETEALQDLRLRVLAPLVVTFGHREDTRQLLKRATAGLPFVTGDTA